MEITYLGHSCFELRAGGSTLVFDPFISPNKLAHAIDLDSLKPDYILLSHGHHDHMADVERIYGNSQATIVANFEIATWFENRGVKNTHPMNIGGKWSFDFGWIKMVGALHSSSLPDGSYGGSPAGFVIQSEEKTFYYAGDTALSVEMKLIGEKYNLDFAFLPIGDNFTMDIKDALEATDYLKITRFIPMHFDTFPYIKIDHDYVRELAGNKKKELLLLKIGEKIRL